MSTFSSLLRLNLLHVVSKWGMAPQCPAFMGRLSSCTVPAVCTGPQCSKWSNLWRRSNTWHLPALNFTVLHYPALFGFFLYCPVFFCTVLHLPALKCTFLYCPALFCTWPRQIFKNIFIILGFILLSSIFLDKGGKLKLFFLSSSLLFQHCNPIFPVVLRIYFQVHYILRAIW